MKRSIASLLLLPIIFMIIPECIGENPPEKFDELISAMIVIPAPPPPLANTSDSISISDEETEDDEFPGDDALPEELVEYFRHFTDEGILKQAEKLSMEVKYKLLEGLEQNPEFLPKLFPLLPKTDPAQARIKRLLDQELESPKYRGRWRQKVTQLLMFNSAYFRKELIEIARNARDLPDTYELVQGVEELQALARLDWETCEPILRSHWQGKDRRIGTAALSILYKHALESENQSEVSEYRALLTAVASDQTTPGYARNKAIETLFELPWKEKEAWFLGLFEDPTSMELHDNVLGYRPLARIVDKDPDYWIPIITKLIGNANRTIHDNAVVCLIQFQNHKARRDALLPLLPWLFDPDWASSNERFRLIQSMGFIHMPESVPGMTHVLNEDKDYDNRGWAAEALSQYLNTETRPDLIAALEKSRNASEVVRIIRSLDEADSVPDGLCISALQALAKQTVTPEGKEQLNRVEFLFDRSELPDPEWVNILVGSYLSRRNESPSEFCMDGILNRIKSLKTNNPAQADRLMEIAYQWPQQKVYRQALDSLQNGILKLDTIIMVLENREQIRKYAGESINRLYQRNNPAGSLGAVLSADQDKIRNILSRKDPATSTMLLAAARLVRESLPLEDVKIFLDGDSLLLKNAAEAYLVAWDSPEAREIIWSHHPNEGYILGVRPQQDPGPYDFDTFDEHEASIKGLMTQPEGPLEILALFSMAHYGGEGDIVLQVYNGKNLFDYSASYGEQRYHTREVTSSDLLKFREALADLNADSLPQNSAPGHHETHYEYLHLTKDKGIRVFFSDPDILDESSGPYRKLRDLFYRLRDEKPLGLKYRLETSIPGTEIIFSDKDIDILAFWKNGQDIRIKIKDRRPQPIKSDASEILADSNNSKIGWFSFMNGTIGSPIPTPQEFSYEEAKETVSPYTVLNSHPWDLTIGSNTYRVGSLKRRAGLWQIPDNDEPVLITEGTLSNPVITPDEKWAIMSKTDKLWAVPNYIVRVHIPSQREIRINLPEADTLEPLAYLEPHGKILLIREKGDPKYLEVSAGPEHTEYYLLDAETGHTEPIRGDFSPFRYTPSRPWQQTGSPNEYWASVINTSEKSTIIGRYSTANFKFSPVRILPDMIINPSNDQNGFWVDMPENRVYLIYWGDLISVPLRSLP